MKHNVLFVDDESHILNALKRLLRKEDYNYYSADSAREGLLILEKNPIQLVISDQRMPEMSGIEFLQKVKLKYPDTLRVILSGYAEVGAIIDAINKGEIYRFISKPWNEEELKVKIRQCLKQYDFLNELNDLVKQTNAQNQELKQINETLKTKIRKTNKDLELYQNILFHLPIPLLGISQEGIVVQINQAFKNSPGSPGVNLGDSIGEIFPDALQAAIRECLKGNSPSTPVESFTIEPLIENGINIGCILLPEETQS